LPIICQNPIVIPPTWEQLHSGEDNNTPHQISIPPSAEINQLPIISISAYHVLFFSILATVFILGIRQIGILQKAELQAYDQMVRLRPDEGKDNRFLVVEITENDFKYQDRMGMQRKWSLSDTAFAQLLKKLRPLKPKVIGLDIYHEEEIPEQSDIAKEINQTDNFIAICKQQDLEAKDTPGIRPPNGIPEDRIGFSDVITDSDKILRRHLWYSTPNSNSPCRTEIAFSLYLALHYLAADGIVPEPNHENSYLKVGNTILKPLPQNAGGYRNLSESYQILLNYRSRNIADSVTLEQVLTDQFDHNLVKDRIVIIGVTAPSLKDYLDTPYGVSKAGVFLQAQMTSQIISAVLDKRPLIWVLPGWGDAILIGVWSVFGAVIAWRGQRIIYLSLGLGGSIIIISASYFLLFWLIGCWLPFIPSVLVVICANGGVLGYVKWQEQLQQSNSEV
jgi:CHASE2 domain-containing sensor protein